MLCSYDTIPPPAGLDPLKNMKYRIVLAIEEKYMLKSTFGVFVALSVAGCSQSSVEVLEPYTLQSGHTYQSVITIATDGTGTVPTITQLQTFALDDTGEHGGKPHVVSTSIGTSDPLVNDLLPSAFGAVVAGVLVSRPPPGDCNITSTGTGTSDLSNTNTSSASQQFGGTNSSSAGEVTGNQTETGDATGNASIINC